MTKTWGECRRWQRSFTGISDRSGIHSCFRKPQPRGVTAGFGAATATRMLGEGLGRVTQPDHGPGCPRGSWSGLWGLFVSSGSWQTLIFLCFCGQDVTKASVQWSRGSSQNRRSGKWGRLSIHLWRYNVPTCCLKRTGDGKERPRWKYWIFNLHFSGGATV